MGDQLGEVVQTWKMTTTVDVHEAAANLSRLLDQAAAGEEIVVVRSGRPIARLVALVPDRVARVRGRLRGKITVADDFDVTPEWLMDAFDGSAE
jgi:prevent-host-death family protein